MTTRIQMWSSPRNLSTAMMYAWRQRADTTVVDEPLYAHYLRVSGREHPGRGDVLAAQRNDGEAVVRDVLMAPYETPVVFFKQMAKHLVQVSRDFMPACHNVLLTREPHEMLTSLQRQLPDATVEDTGFEALLEILQWLRTRGETPIVLDTQRLLQDPQRVLATLCERLGLAFDPAMLSWPAGPKPEDGVWAPHWYGSVHRSTGWKPWTAKSDALRPALQPVLDAIRPMYEALLPYAIV
ncbi:MAG: sulfotransferase family protein [Myxococcota bacterium]